MPFEAANKLFILAEGFGKGENKYIIYDKSEGTGTLLKNEPGSSAGFKSDIDGIMDFWPAGIVNDNQVYRSLDIVTLKKEFENISGKTSIKYPEKKVALQKLISDSDITDNPILMIVTLKKR